MMQEIFRVISLSHRKAPVAVRERMYLNQEGCVRLSNSIREVLEVEEVLVLSTCNRTEIYYSSPRDRFTEILRLICLEKGLRDPFQFERHFEVINDEGEAVRHLFSVSMGLQSQVIGDLQISNQVKRAYATAVEMKLAGPFMHRLLHTIFHANKRVQQETAYRDGAASVSYAACELARELLQMHHTPRVLVVGLGEMGRDVARGLADSFPELTISNRTLAKAQALATETGAQVLPFEDIHDALPNYHLIVSAVSVDQPIFLKSHLDDLAKFQQKFFIDLCVPRTVEPSMEEIPGVIVYDIDDIRSRTDATVAKRVAAIPEVEAIIEGEMAGFIGWRKELTISPVIQRFKEALEDIRKEELARYLKNADAEESALVDKVTRSMVNKIIKLPVLQLKAACQRGEEEALAEVLRDLFNLEAKNTSEISH